MVFMVESSNYQEKLRCHACDIRTHERTEESGKQCSVLLDQKPQKSTIGCHNFNTHKKVFLIKSQIIYYQNGYGYELIVANSRRKTKVNRRSPLKMITIKIQTATANQINYHSCEIGKLERAIILKPTKAQHLLHRYWKILSLYLSWHSNIAYHSIKSNKSSKLKLVPFPARMRRPNRWNMVLQAPLWIHPSIQSDFKLISGF